MLSRRPFFNWCRMDKPLLSIKGEIENPLQLSFTDLAAIDPAKQIVDVSRIAAGRKGDAVPLSALLALARPKPTAKYLGLHAAADNFHASIPLDAVAERGIIIYRLDGQPLSAKSGGPVRFFIPEHATCKTAE